MTGRNELCPCSSGKKFKKCCLNKPRLMMQPQAPPPELIAKAISEFRRKELAQAEWIARYGHIRPCLHVNNWGKKFVAVRNRICWLEKCEYVPDFLVQYVPSLFAKEWCESEAAKPEGQRHPIFEWHVGCMRHKQTGNFEDGKLAVSPDGISSAYLSFAFSLFAIEDNSRLDDLLLQRLKHKDQFQGAWHEIFVESTCLRAGFTVEREDESDPATRHVEFTATHKETGEKFSVEAKSKHRPGVLGYPGAIQPEERLSLAFERRINDAVAKKPKHPLVIFFDTNLPFHAANRVYGPETNGPAVPSAYMRLLLERIRRRNGGQYPFVMLAFTNNPDHYAAAHEPGLPKHVHVMMTEHPAGARGIALSALFDAIPLYGNVPNEFPDF